MRMYMVILSNIKNIESDELFKNKIDDKKFEYWRFTPLSWVIATPDNIRSRDLLSDITECYGTIIQFVFEVEIKNKSVSFPIRYLSDIVSGNIDSMISIDTDNNSAKKNIFGWFELLKSPKYIPKWERGENFDYEEHEKIVNQILEEKYGNKRD